MLAEQTFICDFLRLLENPTIPSPHPHHAHTHTHVHMHAHTDIHILHYYLVPEFPVTALFLVRKDSIPCFAVYNTECCYDCI